VNEDLGIQQIGLAGMGEALAKSLTRRGFTTAIGISGATELNPLVKARQ
jgi:6-phosphogluconate dehydrogenase